MRIEFHPETLEEYGESARYYAGCQEGLELRFIDFVDSSIVWIHRLCGVIDCVESALRSLCDAPTRWAVFEVDVRRRLVRVFPFAILCSVESDHVLIMAVMHLSREPGYWRNRRG
jgi:hypothetical protein